MIVDHPSDRMKRCTSPAGSLRHCGRGEPDTLGVEDPTDSLQQVAVLVDGIRTDERTGFSTRRLTTHVTIII